MSAPVRCPQCGSSDIVEDAHYAQEQMVCADCGCILTEGVLTTTQHEESFLQAVRFSESTGQNESMSKTKLKGIIRVRNLCKVLRLPDTFADTAVSYYEQIFYHPMCHFVSQEKKEAIMGCCVYVTCRQHHWPLTMGTISSLLYSKDELFSDMFRKLILALKIDIPSLSLQDLVKSHCNSLRLFQNAPSAPPKYVENLDNVLQRALHIVELAAETWLVTGRHPIPIITAAAYLSWQSLKPAQRLSCTLTQFCKLCEIDFPNPAPLRLNEFIDTFLKLAQQLPWLKMLSLNKKTVIQHLGDILKHRAYLLRKALAAAELSATEARDSAASEQPSRTTASEQPSRTTASEQPSLTTASEQPSLTTASEQPSLTTASEQPSLTTASEQPSLTTASEQPSRTTASEQPSRTTASEQPSRTTASEQPRHTNPFLPPCMMKAKKRSHSSAFSEDQHVTGDEEILDSEIEQYLRTPAEIEDIQKFQAEMTP